MGTTCCFDIRAKVDNSNEIAATRPDNTGCTVLLVTHFGCSLDDAITRFFAVSEPWIPAQDIGYRCTGQPESICDLALRHHNRSGVSNGMIDCGL